MDSSPVRCQSKKGTAMVILCKLLRGNTLPRLMVGLLVGYFISQGTLEHSLERLQLIQPASATQTIPKTVKTKPDHTEKIRELAKTDHIELFKWGLENYEKNVQDYSTTFLKQERIDKKLKKVEEVDVLFKDEPFSVLMHWRKNAGSVDKLLYVEGQNKDKMLVHPTGLFSWLKSVKRAPDCKEARESSRKTCNQFGFHRSMESLLKVYEQAEKAGDLKTKYVGLTEVDKRKCVAMERLLPPKAKYPYGRLVIEIDVEYLIPTSLTAYDWQGKMVSRYVYKDIKFNIGLKDQHFSPKNNKL
jgi:hypothetical protein